MGRRPKQTFLQRRHTDVQEAHEKMFNIAKHQRNANLNYNEILPHISQNGHNPKIYKQQMLEMVWRKGNPLALLVQPLWKTVWRFLKKLKIELPYDPAIPLLGIYPEKTYFKKIHVPQCSLQHYLQQPRHGSNLNAHQRMNG